nr:hypothetical protein [Candidatus Paceibacterota bacterium]
MKIFKIKKNIDAGFVLLFAVTLASILLSIGLGISNIAFKELSFNISAKDSNSAFLASDTGAECALFNDKLTDSAFPLDGVGKRDISCAGQNIETNFSGTGNTANYDFNILNSSGGSVATCAKVNVFKDKTTNPTKVVVTSSGYNTDDCANISTDTNPHLVERQLVISSTVGIPPTYTSTAPSVTLTATPSSMSSGSSALLSWTTSNGTTRCNASGGSGSDGWLTSPSGTLKSWPNGTQSTGPLTSTQTYTLTCDNYMTPVQLVPFVSAQSSVTVQVTAPAPVCDTSFPNDIFRVCYFDGISAPTTAVAYLSQFNEPTTIASPVGTLSNAFTNDWGGGLVDSSGKSDSVSAVWRGNINFQAGNYVFHVVADDGVQLTVGGVNVINNAWVDQGQTQYNSASVSLSGYTNVQMRWYENGGGAYSKLWWDYTPASCPITGGSIADVGGYRIHTFTTSGAFTVGCAKTVDYLIVGGGGGGASVTDQTGGGGGGGEVVSGTSAL